MKFTVVVQEPAQEHFKKIVKSGDKASLNKLNKILDEFGYNSDQNYLKEYGKAI